MVYPSAQAYAQQVHWGEDQADGSDSRSAHSSAFDGNGFNDDDEANDSEAEYEEQDVVNVHAIEEDEDDIDSSVYGEAPGKKRGNSGR